MAGDWFPISTAECISLMLNTKKKKTLIRPEPLAWFPKNLMIRYAPLQTWKASQPPQAISMAVKNRIANEIEGYIFTSLIDLRFSRHFYSEISLALNIFVYLRVNTEVLL